MASRVLNSLHKEDFKITQTCAFICSTWYVSWEYCCCSSITLTCFKLSVVPWCFYCCSDMYRYMFYTFCTLAFYCCSNMCLYMIWMTCAMRILLLLNHISLHVLNVQYQYVTLYVLHRLHLQGYIVAKTYINTCFLLLLLHVTSHVLHFLYPEMYTIVQPYPITCFAWSVPWGIYCCSAMCPNMFCVVSNLRVSLLLSRVPKHVLCCL
jgi:hypothetical protein